MRQTEIGGQQGIDFERMWSMAGKRVLAPTALPIHVAGAASGSVQIGRPYLTLQHIQPPSFSQLQPVYTIPSMRLQTYSVDCEVDAGGLDFAVKFPYIKLDQLSSLYMIWVEDTQLNLGARKTRYNTAGALRPEAAGNEVYVYSAGYADLFCPIKWETLRISASVKNACLGNMTSDRATSMDMYRIFKTFAGDCKLSFEDWQKYNQCIVFNAKQLGTGVGYGSAFTTITLSVDFRAERPFSETGLTTKHMTWNNVAAPLGGGSCCCLASMGETCWSSASQKVCCQNGYVGARANFIIRRQLRG